MMNKLLVTMITATTMLLCYTKKSTYNVKDFGAIGDGITVNTIAIQQTIDKCAADGGGQVVIPNGKFISGTIYFKDNVEIHLAAGAILKGSTKKTDYDVKDKCLIAGNRKNNIAVTGRGIIDGSGDDPAFYSADLANGLADRPNLFELKYCTSIKLKEFTAINGARWNIHLVKSDFITIDDIKVKSRVVANNDGVDLEDCHYVSISNSYFDCGDDAICPKSTSSRGVKHLVINNCIIKSESNGIKFGTASIGGFQDVTISNCTIYDTRLSGIAIQMVDGGIIDRMVINNIIMHNVNGAIAIKLGKRVGETPGVLQNITITNVIADGIGSWKPVTTDKYYKAAADSKIGISIVGQPNYFVKNITLSDVSFQFVGGGSKSDSRKIMPDAPNTYPEFTNFGITPAYGLNFRHVDGVVLRNVKLSTTSVDARPAIFFDDAKNVDISGLKASVGDEADCFVKFKSVNNVFIHDCKPDAAKISFLGFEGDIKDVSVINNDLRKVKAPYLKLTDVNSKEIKTFGNLK